MKRILSLMALVVACFSTTWAQTQPQQVTAPATTSAVQSFVQVTLNDGALKFGTLLEISESDVVLDIKGLGVTRIPKYLVQSIAKLEVDAQEIEEGYAYVSNQPSRYFFAPSGMQLGKGEGYFQSNVLLNSVSYGYSDRFTGGALVSVLGGGVTAKYGFPIGDKMHVSMGGIAAMDFYGMMDSPLAIGFLNATLGDENKHLTLNVGMANKVKEYQLTHFNWDNSTSVTNDVGVTEYYPSAEVYRRSWNPFLINISGMTPLMPNRWLITENYLILPGNIVEEERPYMSPYGFQVEGEQPYNQSPVELGIISLGIRSYNQQSGWLWDYGLAGVIGDGGGFPVPWFSFTLEF